MARQTHTAVALPSGYPTAFSELTFVAADAANFEQVAFTGKGVQIIVWNTSVDTAYDFTLQSVAAAKTGRTGDVVDEIPFGDIYMTGIIPSDGWRQTDGKVYFKGENAALLFAVIQH